LVTGAPGCHNLHIRNAQPLYRNSDVASWR